MHKITLDAFFGRSGTSSKIHSQNVDHPLLALMDGCGAYYLIMVWFGIYAILVWSPKTISVSSSLE